MGVGYWNGSGRLAFWQRRRCESRLRAGKPLVVSLTGTKPLGAGIVVVLVDVTTSLTVDVCVIVTVIDWVEVSIPTRR